MQVHLEEPEEVLHEHFLHHVTEQHHVLRLARHGHVGIEAVKLVS